MKTFAASGQKLVKNVRSGCLVWVLYHDYTVVLVLQYLEQR